MFFTCQDEYQYMEPEACPQIHQNQDENFLLCFSSLVLWTKNQQILELSTKRDVIYWWSVKSKVPSSYEYKVCFSDQWTNRKKWLFLCKILFGFAYLYFDQELETS